MVNKIKFRHTKLSTIIIVTCLALSLVIVSGLVHADTIVTSGPLTLNFLTGQSLIVVSSSPDYNVTMTAQAGNLTGTAFLTTANNTGSLHVTPTQNGTLAVNATTGVSVLVDGVVYTAPVNYYNATAFVVTWIYNLTVFDLADSVAVMLVAVLITSSAIAVVFMTRRRREQ